MIKTSRTYSTDLPIVLEKLIKLKKLRDCKNFTASKLATAVNVDRSLIQRLLKGGVENPRMDTLIKIVNFFKNDGFNLRIDDLIGLNTNVVDVQEQIVENNKPISLPLYQMNNFNGERIGFVPIVVSDASPGIIAIISDEDIKPIFKAGSLFIVDTFKKPEHKNLVVVRIRNNYKLMIRKYFEKNGDLILTSFDPNDKEIKFTKDLNYNFIGVVIRINAKT